MKLARVTGTVTATAKDHQLTGIKLLVADLEDGHNKVVEKSVVVADACGGAGPGDQVLLTTGSAARLPNSVAGIPVDMAIVAIVDHIDIEGG